MSIEDFLKRLDERGEAAQRGQIGIGQIGKIDYRLEARKGILPENEACSTDERSPRVTLPEGAKLNRAEIEEKYGYELCNAAYSIYTKEISRKGEEEKYKHVVRLDRDSGKIVQSFFEKELEELLE